MHVPGKAGRPKLHALRYCLAGDPKVLKLRVLSRALNRTIHCPHPRRSLGPAACQRAPRKPRFPRSPGAVFTLLAARNPRVRAYERGLALKPKCAIYTRVSSTDQTMENQKRDLLRYCQGHEMEVVALFEDTDVSGAQKSRPQLDEMMVQARQRRFDIVLVWKFDRFARSTSHLLAALQEFRDLGVDFISYSSVYRALTAVSKVPAVKPPK